MQEIYQDKILELAKLVKLSQPISEPTHTGEKNNPICGDKVIINAVIKNGIIIDIHLIVRGCALCEAGAGLLGKTAINRNMDDLITLKDEMNGYLKNNEQPPDSNSICFEPVKKIKNRIACVLLAFDATSEMKPITVD